MVNVRLVFKSQEVQLSLTNKFAVLQEQNSLKRDDIDNEKGVLVVHNVSKATNKVVCLLIQILFVRKPM